MAALPPAPAPLSDEALGAMLRSMGYSPEAASDGKRTEYTIEVDRPNSLVRAAVFFTSDRKLVCVASRMGGAVDPKSPAGMAGLLRLMRKNTEMGLVYFGFNEQDNHIWLLSQTANAGLTPARLGEMLNRFVNAADTTKDLWNTAKWQSDDAASGNTNGYDPARFDISRYILGRPE
jgi:hypothetical protein